MGCPQKVEDGLLALITTLKKIQGQRDGAVVKSTHVLAEDQNSVLSIDVG